ncbi:MAG: TonB-dependent receptor, partial [Saprospiraceae bacterium]|nr:TonB-dependent receptor [Saprospiraceae bacterium]
RFGDAAGFDWGNTTSTIRWNHLFSERLFGNVTLYYSDYDYELHFGDEVDNRFDWQSSIINYSIKPDLTYYIDPSNVIRFGGQAIVYDFLPGAAIGVSEGEVTDVSLDDKYAIESGVFAEHELDLGTRWEVNYGLRLSHFNYTGKGRAYEYAEAPPGVRRLPVSVTEYDQWESIKTYASLEPRVAIKFQLDVESSLKASYNRMAQYIHLISNTTAATPVDVWTPSTNNLRPQIANQVAAGYFRNFNNNTYELSAEVYYKKMDRLVDYIDGADLILNEFLEGDLLAGEGRAYGFEFQFKKNTGRFSGWLSYTISKSERLVEGINDDAWYPSRFDQPHSLSITTFYDVSKRLSLSANFILNSGTPTTFPTSRIEQQGYVIPYNGLETRNNVRIPAYHRLDISATLQGKQKKGNRWKGQWVFSVYNVYNRRNPFSIFFRQDENRIPVGQPIVTEAVRLSVIGNFIPSVSYNFKF